MLSLVQREEMKRNAAKLRQISVELRELAPSISIRAASLASDVEMRVFMAERQAVSP